MTYLQIKLTRLGLLGVTCSILGCLLGAQEAGATGPGTVSPGSDTAFKLALSLREKGSWSDADVNTAIKLLEEKDTEVFLCTVTAIMGKGGRPPLAIAALNKAYKSTSGKKRMFALVALREFDDQREDLKAHIKSLLISKDTDSIRLALSDLLYFPGLFEECADQVRAILNEEPKKRFLMGHILTLYPLIVKHPAVIPQADVYQHILLASQDKAAREPALMAAGTLYQALDTQREGLAKILNEGLRDENLLVSSVAVVSVLLSNAAAEGPVRDAALKRALLSGDEKIIRMIISKKEKVADKAFDLSGRAREIAASAEPDKQAVLNKVLSEAGQ